MSWTMKTMSSQTFTCVFWLVSQALIAVFQMLGCDITSLLFYRSLSDLLGWG